MSRAPWLLTRIHLMHYGNASLSLLIYYKQLSYLTRDLNLTNRFLLLFVNLKVFKVDWSWDFMSRSQPFGDRLLQLQKMFYSKYGALRKVVGGLNLFQFSTCGTQLWDHFGDPETLQTHTVGKITFWDISDSCSFLNGKNFFKTLRTVVF